MHPSLGMCRGNLSKAAQSRINLCRSPERLLLLLLPLPPMMMMMMMMLSSGRASLFVIIWCSGDLFLRRSPDLDPSPVPAHGSETSPGPSTPRDQANGEESYFEPF
jgi:hypothetical protein